MWMTAVAYGLLVSFMRETLYPQKKETSKLKKMLLFFVFRTFIDDLHFHRGSFDNPYVTTKLLKKSLKVVIIFCTKNSKLNSMLLVNR